MRSTVQALGDGTRGLQPLPVGTWVVAEGPYGAVTSVGRTRRDVLLIAGGVGITPMHALFEAMPLTPGDDLLLLCRAPAADDVLFRDEIDAIAARRGARALYMVGRGYGGLTPAGLRQLVPDIADRDVYLCGSPRLPTAVRTALQELGLPPRQLREKRFTFRPAWDLSPCRPCRAPGATHHRHGVPGTAAGRLLPGSQGCHRARTARHLRLELMPGTTPGTTPEENLHATASQARHVTAAGVLTLGGLGLATTVAAPIAAAVTVTEAPAGRGQALTDALADLVTGGTLTQEQADTVASTLAVSNALGGGGHDRGHLLDLEVAATALGLTEDDLRTALQADGTTLSTVADAQGVEVSTVSDALLAAATDRIEQRLADGDLTQDQADARLADLPDRIDALLTAEIADRPGRRGETDGDQAADAETTGSAAGV